MEIDKIDTFLENNKNVTEQMLYSLISNNNEANLSKVVESCSNGILVMLYLILKIFMKIKILPLY